MRQDLDVPTDAIARRSAEGSEVPSARVGRGFFGTREIRRARAGTQAVRRVGYGKRWERA